MRTLASHRAYYERWAKTWEFLGPCSRLAPSHVVVGQAYCDAAHRWWQASTRQRVPSTTCRPCAAGSSSTSRRPRQTASQARPRRAARRGVLGCSAQLVHGRADAVVAYGTTLDRLAAPSAGGYVGVTDAATLATAYRLL